MDIALLRNGYHLERRKMYPSSPRNNLVSQVSLHWIDSIQEPYNISRFVKEQKQKQRRNLKQQYDNMVEKKIEKQLNMDKSTFRVMPAPQKIINPNSYFHKDSLNQQLQQYNNSKTINYDNYDSPLLGKGTTSRRQQQSLSKSVFGYEIDQQAYGKRSYLSKILDDRLQPYLRKQSKSFGKHQSFQINHPIKY